MNNNYEINNETLAIIPISYNETKILERDSEYIIKEKAFKIMDYSCKYYGSSYNGRVQGTKNIINFEYKLPVIVEDSSGIIFFPTESPDSLNCIWLSFKNIKSVEKNNGNGVVIFDNNFKLELDISFNSLNSQIFRSSLLISKLDLRRKRV
ncbi:MAG: competence protein ComK [Bacilli bacterium]|nr:competence protein ComK [Bacilli bacterium]